MSAKFYQPLKSMVLFLVNPLRHPKEYRHKQLPKILIISIFIIGILPSFLGWAGMDFGTTEITLDFETLSQLEPSEAKRFIYHALRGSYIHTILEWSAFCTALFTALFSLAHFSIRPTDAATPVIGLALFGAGCMDAFHTLAADNLIEVVSDQENFIVFTWAVCRLFNVTIMMLGVSFFLVIKPTKKFNKNIIKLSGLSLVLAIVAYLTIKTFSTRQNLPETLFPDALITRPWDVGPLILFILAGFFLYPRFYRKYPSLFSHSLMLSTIPDIAVQLHMAFGSTTLFDHHFNIAHFLKIVAYLVPLIGLILDYIYTHSALQESNQYLSLEILERQQSEAALKISEYKLTEKTKQLELTLSELQQTQTQLIQTEKMLSLGQLVGGIAHEINNAVNMIYGNLIHLQGSVEDFIEIISLYKKKYPQTHVEINNKIEDIDLEFIIEDTPRMLKSMQEGSKRIRIIVESLRNFSHLDEAAVKSVNLQEGIESTLLILTQKLHSITVIKEYGKLPKIECYPAELNQVWMHLLTNAIDSFQLQKQPKIWIQTILLNPHQICVKMKDNGCGIPEKFQSRIFDPFFTTKEVGKGTGLGLSVCYSIIKHHGGEIQVNSTPGEGTEFSITLSDCLKT